jgi:opacity protein-like surface antigen
MSFLPIFDATTNRQPNNMLKSLLAGTVLLLSSSLIAQSGYWDKSKIGLVIGPKFNNSTVINGAANTSYTFEEKGSFNFGANMVTKLNNRIAINYGVTATWNALERKDKCETCDVAVAQTSNLKYRYITVPVQLQVYFQNDRLDIFGIAGFNYNHLTKSFGDYASASGTTYELINLKENTAKSLYGLEVGAGIDYNISFRGSVRLNVTYQHYLNSFSTTPEAKMSAISITPGIFYQF